MGHLRRHDHVRDVRGASAFDQDLGWCVDDDVNLDAGSTTRPCASTSCGVVGRAVTSRATVRSWTTAKIRRSRAWLADATAAEATYGHISTWETGG